MAASSGGSRRAGDGLLRSLTDVQGRTSSPRPPARVAGWLRWIPFAVLSFGLSLTFVAIVQNRQHIQDIRRLRQQQVLEEVTTALEANLAQSLQTADAFTGLYASSDSVNDREFARFYASTRASSQAGGAVRAVGFLRWDARGPSATVTRMESGGKEFRDLMGKDLWNDPRLQRAMERSRRERRAILAEPNMDPAREPGSEQVLQLLKPVFAGGGGGDGLSGWILVSLDLSDLVETSLGDPVRALGSPLRIEILDASTQKPEERSVLYRSGGEPSAAPLGRLNGAEPFRAIEAGGRFWSVAATPLEERALTPAPLWPVLLLLGTAGSAAISLTSWWLVRQHIRTVRALQQTDAAKSERDKALGKLRLSAEAFQLMDEGLVIAGLDRSILAVNEAYRELTGEDSATLVAREAQIFDRTDLSPQEAEEIWKTLLAEAGWRGQIWHRRADSTLCPALLSLRRVDDGANRPSTVLGIFTDLSTLHEKDQQLDQLAFHDALTDLPNQRRLHLHIEETIRNSRRPLMLIWIDLDHLKRINDSFGHDQGDAVLVDVAERLKACLPEGDLLGRLGGDEFLVVHHPSGGNDVDDPLPKRLLQAIQKPLALRGNRLVITLSGCAGVSLYPSQGGNAPDLLRYAATAHSTAKEAGPGSIRFYSSSMTEASRRRLELETRLQMALDQEKELYVVYQPQVDREGRLLGCEALVRWRSESLGEVNPAELIPHAEATGLIQPLGIWMLRATCRQIAAWRRAGLQVPKIAVNVSSQQFLDAEAKLPGIVRECLEQNQLSPADLELEITESCLLPGGHAEPQIRELAGMGISIAVDDFGTGYSSLSMLHNLPITKLKIDRCFVQNVDTNPALQKIIQATVTMAAGMGMSTLAEGVERAEEVEFLAAHGCRNYQGYYFSRPVSAEQFADLLASGSVVPAGQEAPV